MIGMSGQYRCTASNGLGIANKTVNVTVRCELQELSMIVEVLLLVAFILFVSEFEFFSIIY